MPRWCVPLAGCILLLLAACDGVGPTPTPVIIVVTATPEPPTPAPPTATPEPAPPTPTPAPPMATPVPATPVRALGFGDTVIFHDWTISLARLEYRPSILVTRAGAETEWAGDFYLLWVDARNGPQRYLDLDNPPWVIYLEDSQGHYHHPLRGDDSQQITQVGQEGRDPLKTMYEAHELTHLLLVFRATVPIRPAALAFAWPDTNPRDEIRFHLDAWVPPPTATPLPTPTPAPLPGLGDTLETLGWRISLAKIASRKRVSQSDYYYYEANGLFWLLYVDARNLENATRSLENTVDWVLVDDHGARYNEEQKWQPFTFGAVAEYAGRAALNYGVTPRGLTHPLLFFDVAADAKPAYLLLGPASHGGGVRDSAPRFDLQPEK